MSTNDILRVCKGWESINNLVILCHHDISELIWRERLNINLEAQRVLHYLKGVEISQVEVFP